MVKLARALGVRRAEAVGCFVSLCAWAVDNRPDGVMSNCDNDDLEIAAQWEGDQGLFAKAVRAVRLVDDTPDGPAIHDWMERAGSYKEARRKHNERSESRELSQDIPTKQTDKPPVSENVQDSPGTVLECRTTEDRTGEERTRQEKKQNQPQPPAAAASPPPGPGVALAVVGPRPLGKPRPVSPHAADIAAAHAHWRTYHPQARDIKTTSDGYKKAGARLRDGHTLADLRTAIDGCHATPWYVENNQTAFEFIMRPDKFLMFLENATAPPQPLTEKDRVAQQLYRRAAAGGPGMFDGV